MKNKQDILKDAMATLAECQFLGLEYTSNHATVLRIRLGLYYEILGEDIPEEYWEDFETYSIY